MEKDFVHGMVYLDIETLPSSDTFEYEKPPRYLVGEHGSLKDPDKIKEWKEKKYKELCDKAKDEAEKEWRSESLKSHVGRIFCISFAINEGSIITIDARNGEKEMLVKFYEAIKPYRTISFCGVNVAEFDLLFLLHRAFHYGLFDLANKLRLDRGYSKDQVWDIMHLASGNLVWKYRISLDNLCKLFGIETSKDDINGSQVLDTYLKGEYDRICTYCAKDVDRTRKLFKLLK